MSPICGIEPFVKRCGGFKERRKRINKGCNGCVRYKAFVEKQNRENGKSVSPAKTEARLASVQSILGDPAAGQLDKRSSIVDRERGALRR